jgi:hypothetical protein
MTTIIRFTRGLKQRFANEEPSPARAQHVGNKGIEAVDLKMNELVAQIRVIQHNEYLTQCIRLGNCTRAAAAAKKQRDGNKLRILEVESAVEQFLRVGHQPQRGGRAAGDEQPLAGECFLRAALEPAHTDFDSGLVFFETDGEPAGAMCELRIGFEALDNIFGAEDRLIGQPYMQNPQ